MNFYKISEEQINQVIKLLAELPAKYSYNFISFLRQLPVIESSKDASKQ